VIRFLVIVAALASFGWSLTRWRQAVKVSLYLLVFEGALRKWVVPGAQDLVYFTKDVFVLGALVGCWQSGELRRQIRAVPIGIRALLLAGIAYGTLEVFNPEMPTPLVGLLGLRSYFLYASLLLLMPGAFLSERELFVFLRRFVLLVIPVAMLAALQFGSPAESTLNAYARGGPGADIAQFGEESRVRVTGTFSYISGFTAYLLGISLLALGLLAARGFRLRGNLAIFAALSAAALATFMTGSRGPIIILFCALPIYWWMTIATERGDAGALGRMAAIFALLAALLSYVGTEAIEAFRERAAGGEQEVAGRMLYPFTAPLHAFEDGGLFGFGIGSTHQALTSITGGAVPEFWLRGIAFEAESGRVMLELGPLGFFLIFPVRILLAGLAYRLATTLRSRLHRGLAASCLAYLLSQVVGNVVFDPTNGMLYWFFAGLLLTLERIEATAAVPALAKPLAAVPSPRRKLDPVTPAW